MTSIALYARVSSEQQAQRATIDSQVSALKERVRADGYHVLPGDQYIDDGFSGATLVRPALERLRDRIAEGMIDVVYVHSPDRLARRYAYQVLLLEEFAAHGVRVIFVHGSEGTNPEQALLTQVQGMIAEYERARILERNRRGKIHRARQGLVNPMSGAPYGYRYVRRTETEPARYEILLHEARVVRQVFDALVHRQQSIGQIVRELNRANVPTRRGASRWDRSTVWGVLRNPAYAGQAAYGKTESAERGTLLRAIRNKNPNPRRTKSTDRDKPPEQWIRIPVPALVPADTFEAAARQLERNKKLAERNARGRRYLLQGLVVCARCGYAFYGKTVSQAQRKGRPAWAYYRCVGTDAYRFAGGRVCQNGQVRADQIDGYVWDSVRRTLEQPERVFDEWSRRAKSDAMQTERRAQRDESARIVTTHERTLQRLLDAYEAGVLDLAELTARSTRVKGRLERARAELEHADAKLNEVVSLRLVIGRLETFAETVRHRLDQLDWEGRRDLIRTLVARVEIDEHGATVVYRVPGNRSSGSSDPRPTSDTVESSSQLRGRRTFPFAQ